MCDEYTIYALRGPKNDLEKSQMLYWSLKWSEGRFGWSNITYADLYRLRDKIKTEGRASLSKRERECNQDFLLNLRQGDYVIYINVPEQGKCTLARVTGPYVWRYTHKDFNHRFPVDPESVRVFDRNSDIVPLSLRRSLRPRGRKGRIRDKESFEVLLKNLKAGKEGKPHTQEG